MAYINNDHWTTSKAWLRAPTIDGLVVELKMGRKHIIWVPTPESIKYLDSVEYVECVDPKEISWASHLLQSPEAFGRC